MYCQACGEKAEPRASYCRRCGAQLVPVALRAKHLLGRKNNRYDESVKEWFTSKTFKTLLMIGLVGGCCFAVCSLTYYSSLIGILNNLLSIPSEEQSSLQPSETQVPTRQRPYVVGSTNDNDIDPEVKAALNTWVSTAAPLYAPYWFVTYWQRGEDGRVYVSLAALNLSSPDEEWTLVDDVNPSTPSKVLWTGSVVVDGRKVELLHGP